MASNYNLHVAFLKKLLHVDFKKKNVELIKKKFICHVLDWRTGLTSYDTKTLIEEQKLQNSYNIHAGMLNLPNNHLQDITLTSSIKSSHLVFSLLKMHPFLAFQITQITSSRIIRDPFRIFLFNCLVRK